MTTLYWIIGGMLYLIIGGYLTLRAMAYDSPEGSQWDPGLDTLMWIVGTLMWPILTPLMLLHGLFVHGRASRFSSFLSRHHNKHVRGHNR